MDMQRLLKAAIQFNASDLHVQVGSPPTVRVDGTMVAINAPPVTAENLRELVVQVANESQLQRLESDRSCDFSYSIPDVARFRINVFHEQDNLCIAARSIPLKIKSFAELGLPAVLQDIAEEQRGLVLMTGTTGSGKSTTLAAIIDHLNRTERLRIVTVEDPIEFLHSHKRSIITQREIGEDTDSFGEALRRVLRQDPDVILVGELRDLETISMALTAAETGHLVFGTLHTQDAPQTIDRIIDVFPTQQQEQIRVMLASTLEGVVTQQLVPTADGLGRAACAEVLVCTSAIRNLIRQGKTHQIYSLMQVGGSFGMQTMDQGLAQMVKSGVISESIAYDRSSNEEDLRNHLHL